MKLTPPPEPGRLVLRRREGQAILIGDDVFVQVIAANGGAARIMVVAPRNVPVDRAEIAKDRRRRGRG